MGVELVYRSEVLLPEPLWEQICINGELHLKISLVGKRTGTSNMSVLLIPLNLFVVMESDFYLPPERDPFSFQSMRRSGNNPAVPTEFVLTMVTVSSQSGYWVLHLDNEKCRVWFFAHIGFWLLSSLYGYLPWSRFVRREDLPK